MATPVPKHTAVTPIQSAIQRIQAYSWQGHVVASEFEKSSVMQTCEKLMERVAELDSRRRGEGEGLTEQESIEYDQIGRALHKFQEEARSHEITIIQKSSSWRILDFWRHGTRQGLSVGKKILFVIQQMLGKGDTSCVRAANSHVLGDLNSKVHAVADRVLERYNVSCDSQPNEPVAGGASLVRKYTWNPAGTVCQLELSDATPLSTMVSTVRTEMTHASIYESLSQQASIPVEEAQARRAIMEAGLNTELQQLGDRVKFVRQRTIGEQLLEHAGQAVGSAVSWIARIGRAGLSFLHGGSQGIPAGGEAVPAEAPAPEVGAAGTTTGPIPQKVTEIEMLQDLLARQAGKKLYDRALVRLMSKTEAMERVQNSPFDLQIENSKTHIANCKSGDKQTLYRWERKNDQVFLYQYTLSPGQPGNLSENGFVEVKQTYDSKDHAVWNIHGQKPASFPASFDNLPLLDDRLDQLLLEEQRRTSDTLASVVVPTNSIGRGAFSDFQKYCETLNGWVTDQLITEGSLPRSFQATYIDKGKYYLGKIEWNEQSKQFEVQLGRELKKGSGNTFLVGDVSFVNSENFLSGVQELSQSLQEFQRKVSAIKSTQDQLVRLAENTNSGKEHVLNPLLTTLPVSVLSRPYYCFDLQPTGQERIKSGIIKDSVYQLANPTVSLLTTEGDRSVVLTYPLTITSQAMVKLSQELKAKLTIGEDKEYTVTELQELLNERCVGTVTKLVRDIKKKEKELFQSYKDRNISDAREALPQYISRNESEDRQRTWYCIAENEGALASGSAYAVYFHRSSGAEATFQTPIPIVCLPDGRLSYKGDIFRDLQALHGKIRGVSGTDAWEINSEMFEDRRVGDKWQSWDQLHPRQ